MELTGEREIGAPRQTVWEALNDPEVLKASIPGCQSIEKTSDTELNAKVKAKVGPVNATFSGKVNITNLNPPESYTISGEGTGGAAGFAKGGADVMLEDRGESTLLRYTANAQVGGKLAQLGQRLIKSTADKYAKQFFDNFSEKVAPTAQDDGDTAEAATTSAPAAAAESPAAAASATAAETSSQPAAETTTAAPASDSAETSERKGLSPVTWISALVFFVLVLLALFAT
jgi:hypothetical protein